jgi:hypothetical protein
VAAALERSGRAAHVALLPLRPLDSLDVPRTLFYCRDSSMARRAARI